MSYPQTCDWQWAKSAGGITDQELRSIDVNSKGNIYVAGFFDSPTIDFGSTTLTNKRIRDIFLAELGNGTEINESNNFHFDSERSATPATGNH